MGKKLLENEPVFRASLEQCDELLQQYVDWSLLETDSLLRGRLRLNEIDVMWPTLFAIEVALASCGDIGALSQMLWLVIVLEKSQPLMLLVF
jgi:acyl transferase domain-containing protein